VVDAERLRKVVTPVTTELKLIHLEKIPKRNKMAKQIGEDTKVTFDLKTIGMGVAGLAALIGMWFTLQADIAEAKELPEPLPSEVTRMEFDMKDQLIRQTIMTTQEDVTEIKDDMKRIEEKIDNL